MLSPGREHDLKLLEDKLREAKTVEEREKWKHKIRQILNESKHKNVVNGRANLIDAIKSGDHSRIDAATKVLHDIGRYTGTSK